MAQEKNADGLTEREKQLLSIVAAAIQLLEQTVPLATAYLRETLVENNDLGEACRKLLADYERFNIRL